MPATYGFLSTYPPTQCGLATFNAALAAHLNTGRQRRRRPAARQRQRQRRDRTRPGRAAGRAHLAHRQPRRLAAAANALNRFDVAILQHEYGIYPGDAGAEVLPLLRALKVPAIVVLHTVLSHPDPLQRQVLERIVATADALVTMTDTARQRLIAGYAVDPRKISVIPHGAGSHDAAPARGPRPAAPAHLGAARAGQGHRVGAAGAGPARATLDPAPVYTVAGRTHPKVLEQFGRRVPELAESSCRANSA